jgi:hypothetical protein
MHTNEIVEPALKQYKSAKLTDERIDFLKNQVTEQLTEIRQNQDIYKEFINKINPPEKIDDIILWMLIMCNEDMVEEYVDKYDKSFMDIIPVSDLADLLFYLVYKKTVEGIETDGFDFLLSYEDEGIEDFDQYCFTNVLVYVQTMKKLEAQIDF